MASFFAKKQTDEEFDAAARALILAKDAAGLEPLLKSARATALNKPPAGKVPLLFLTVMHDQLECTRQNAW